MSVSPASLEARKWLENEGFDLAALDAPPSPAAPVATGFVPDLMSYEIALVAFSGGKDSLGLVLRLLDLGFPRERIELHHHLVDGNEGSTLMDWPITEAYCKAIANALGIPITFSWRRHGFEGEMCRNGNATAAMMIPNQEGGHTAVGGSGPPGIRLKFPQVSNDLQTRWCSSALKIALMDAYVRNHPKFLNKRTLVLTGERAEESKARATYSLFEPHRSDTRNSKRVPRHIDVWRAVHAWTEHDVWEAIRRWRLVPHPCYFLGWSRCSCRSCIFGSSDQWASVRAIAPDQFGQIANYEREFKVTIHRTMSVVERADRGMPYEFDPYWVKVANSREFTVPVFMDPWVLPKGAFGNSCGPT